MPSSFASANAPFRYERLFIGLLLFMYASGLLAHSLPALRPLTLATTDLFLLFFTSTILFLVYRRQGDARMWWWVLIAYIGTFAVEAVGTATGRIFGDYSYGPTMRWQLFDVPLVIALNWVVLILATNHVAAYLRQGPVLHSLVASLLIAIYDYFIEPVAIKLAYWTWAAGDIPLRNYLAWAVVAFIFSLPLNWLRIRYRSPVLPVYLLVQLLYFILLNALL